MAYPFTRKTYKKSAVLSLMIILLFGAGIYSGAAESMPVVTAIKFAPTQYLSEADMLAAVTETKVGEPFESEKLINDMWHIMELGTERHGEQVFYDFEAELLEDGDGVIVVIYPIEMPVIKDFVVDIDTMDDTEFLRHFTMEPGRVLNVDALHDAIEEARDALFQTTGQFFYLTELTMGDDNVVHIQLRTVYVGEVRVEGNEKTRDYVIERVIKLRPGDVFDRAKLDDDVRRIFFLRLFDDVGVDIKERPDDPFVVDIVYTVSERQTGSAGFGAGYGSADKLFGYLELADENLFGRGQYGAVRWEFGTKKSSYDLTFHEPNVGGSGTSFGISLYNRTLRLPEEADEKYDERHSVGGYVTVGKQFTDFLQGTARLKVENIHNIHEDDALSQRNRTRSVRLGLNGDTTDQPFNPKRGMRYGLGTEIAGHFLGGDTEFTKYEANWSTYQGIGKKDSVIAFRLMGGFSPAELPNEELYRIGGPESVRAYNYGAFKGDRMLVGNLEYRMKLGDGIQGALFVDAGNAWKANDEMNLSDLNMAYGLGVRFDTPLGIMRLDYGIGKAGGRAFFSIGPSF